MFICNLHCQLFYVFPVICYIKTRPDAKFSIVPEEGWFGQPKYSTRSKKHSTLCRFLPLYSSLKKDRRANLFNRGQLSLSLCININLGQIGRSNCVIYLFYPKVGEKREGEGRRNESKDGRRGRIREDPYPFLLRPARQANPDKIATAIKQGCGPEKHSPYAGWIEAILYMHRNI